MDDSPLDAQRARQLLDDEYEVHVFPDGSAALEALASKPPPHVLLLDWVMPGISGVEVCRFLRSPSGGHAPCAIVLLTIQSDTAQIVEGLSAGANDYLPKPYEAEELRARVRAQMRAQELLERALRAEERNRLFLESAPDPMIALDGEGRVGFANAEACRILGSTPDALLGQPLTRMIPDFPDLTRAEHSVVLPDVMLNGRLFSPTVRAVATRDADAMISLREVTAQREKERRRLDFYSIIAHDLRSPLSSLSLRTRLILDGHRGELSSELRDDMRKIDVHIKALVEMINDFLEIARSDATPLSLESSDVDVAEVLDSTVESLQPLLSSGNLAWRRQVSNELPEARVRGDARRLAQVFTNLVGNAIKFTPPGGVVTTTLERKDGWLEVGVEDTGPGVPRAAMQDLFERYTRAPGSAAVQGTGLGLMIVRQIVEAHGGSAGIDAERSAGSRFWVRLPIV